MKRRFLAVLILLLTCGGCVAYYHEPYAYRPYSYAPYYYPSRPYVYPGYRPPAYYYAPVWPLFYPSFYFGHGYRGYRGHGHHHGHRR